MQFVCVLDRDVLLLTSRVDFFEGQKRVENFETIAPESISFDISISLNLQEDSGLGRNARQVSESVDIVSNSP